MPLARFAPRPAAFAFLFAAWPVPGATVQAQDAPPSAAAHEELDWSAINVDAATIARESAKAAKRPGVKDSAASWDRKVNSDGSSETTVKRKLGEDWKVGGGVASGPAPVAPADPRAYPLDAPRRDAGAAWANVGASGIEMEARVDPQQEQSKLGANLSRTMPLGEALSLTLKNSNAVVRPMHETETSLGSVSSAVTSSTLSQTYTHDGTAKLTILPSGTTISAGASSTSTDEKWRRNFGAEQKLFGGMSVSGAVSENSTGTLDKSLKAGFSTTW